MGLGGLQEVGLTRLGDGVDLGKVEGEACPRCLPDL